MSSASISYSKDSLTDIAINTPERITGTVVVNEDKTVTLNNNSRCLFTYQHASSEKLSFDHMKVNYKINDSTGSLFTRYKSNIRIDITFEFYEEVKDTSGNVTGYTDGIYQYNRIYPYTTHEIEGYKGSVEIDVNDKIIKKMWMEIIFEYDTADGSTYQINFEYCNVYVSRTTQQVVTDTYGMSVVLNKVIGYMDGCKLYYQDQTLPTVLQWVSDGEGGLAGVKVNPGTSGERTVIFEKKTIYLAD